MLKLRIHRSHPDILSINKKDTCERQVILQLMVRNPAITRWDWWFIPVFKKPLSIQGGCLGFLNHQQYHVPKVIPGFHFWCSTSLATLWSRDCARGNGPTRLRVCLDFVLPKILRKVATLKKILQKVNIQLMEKFDIWHYHSFSFTSELLVLPFLLKQFLRT